MTDIAIRCEDFFTKNLHDHHCPSYHSVLAERLPVQRGASEHTCQSYAYAFQLLFHYASERYHVNPSELELDSSMHQ